MAEKIVFLRIAWMVHYQGDIHNDRPTGAGSYVTDNGDGGEVLNFRAVRGRLYGYARMQDNRNLNITRLGAERDAEFIDSVTIVFFARNPVTGGQYIVGWYKNARLYKQTQRLDIAQRAAHPWYTCTARFADGFLLPVTQRTFAVPVDGPGQTNAWYVMEYAKSKAYLRKFRAFQDDPVNYGSTKISKNNKSRWLKDVEKRKAIEMAAMTATELHFSKIGYTVKYVHRENLGWDMEATLGRTLLQLEVKGTGGPLNSVELTPNEYRHSAKHATYRVCIVENALHKTRSTLHICMLDSINGYWLSDTGRRLAIREIISAKLELNE